MTFTDERADNLVGEYAYWSGTTFEPPPFLATDFDLNLDFLFQPDGVIFFQEMQNNDQAVVNNPLIAVTPRTTDHQSSQTRCSSPLPDTALPTLRLPNGLIPSKHYHIKSVTPDTRLLLCEVVGLSNGTWFWLNNSSTDFPHEGQLDHCLDMYFYHFDQV